MAHLPRRRRLSRAQPPHPHRLRRRPRAPRPDLRRPRRARTAARTRQPRQHRTGWAGRDLLAALPGSRRTLPPTLRRRPATARAARCAGHPRRRGCRRSGPPRLPDPAATALPHDGTPLHHDRPARRPDDVQYRRHPGQRGRRRRSRRRRGPLARAARRRSRAARRVRVLAGTVRRTGWEVGIAADADLAAPRSRPHRGAGRCAPLRALGPRRAVAVHPPHGLRGLGGAARRDVRRLARRRSRRRDRPSAHSDRPRLSPHHLVPAGPRQGTPRGALHRLPTRRRLDGPDPRRRRVDPHAERRRGGTTDLRRHRRTPGSTRPATVFPIRTCAARRPSC